MAKMGPLNTTTNCLINTSVFSQQLHPDIVNLGYYVVPLTDFPFPFSTFLGIVVTTAILLAFPVLLFGMVIALREARSFKTGSPFFFLVMIIGCIMVYLGVLTWPMDPSQNVCYARIWLPSLGATIAIGALITKNVRIYLLFYNPFKFRAEMLSLKLYFPVVVALAALDIIILAIYTAYGPQGVTVVQGTDGLGTYETRHVCATSDTGTSIIYAILVFHFVQLFCGCVLSFMLRNVTTKEFNERKSVAMTIYIITFCLIIVTTLVGVAGVTNQQLIVVVSLALLISNTGCLVLIFGSRLVDLYMREVNPIDFATKGMAGSPNHTSSTAKSKTSQEDETNSSAVGLANMGAKEDEKSSAV